MKKEEREKIDTVFTTSLKTVIGGYILLTGHHKLLATSLTIDGEVYDIVVVKSEGDKE